MQAHSRTYSIDYTVRQIFKMFNRKTFSKKQSIIPPTFRSVDDRPSSVRRTKLSSIHRFLKTQRSKTTSAMQSRKDAQRTPRPAGQR